MAKKETKKTAASPTPQASWAIALEWFQQNQRSLAVLVQPHLCPKCAKKLSAKGHTPSPEALIAAMESCCARSKDFINDQLPVMESVFRLFLVNGNRPMELEEIARQLSERRGGDPYRAAPETLLRLLKNDRYYGLQEVKMG